METVSKMAAIGMVVVWLAMVALARVPWNVRGSHAPAAEYAPVTPVRTRPVVIAAQSIREGKPIDINRASKADFELLPGIGPKLSERIIAYRRTHGQLRSVEALMNVSGIGTVKLAKIKPFVFARGGSVDNEVEKPSNNGNLQVKHKASCNRCGDVRGMKIERGKDQEGLDLKPQRQHPRKQIIETSDTVSTDIESGFFFPEIGHTVNSSAEKWYDFEDID
jgi:competence ComEA-like helix-hairpin-helix protein